MAKEPTELHGHALLEGDLGPDPLKTFGRWFREAEAAGLRLPEAMALATASAGGVPSVRMVLLKGFDQRGYVFYTNYESRKGRELAENPRAALLFYWDPLGRQVRIDGSVDRVLRQESEAYFATRPPGSRASAAASRQSEVIQSRAALEAAVEGIRRQFPDDDVPLPEWWGGYRLAPTEYEFWQHREDRLHDRLRYRLSGDAWTVERLSP